MLLPLTTNEDHMIILIVSTTYCTVKFDLHLHDYFFEGNKELHIEMILENIDDTISIFDEAYFTVNNSFSSIHV